MHSLAHNHYDSMSNQYPIVNVFRALGMEPHVCGHRHLSALLLVFSYTVMLLSVGFAYYVFVAIRLFGKYSNVDEVISSILCVGLFVANISCTLHAIVRRRQLADILPAIQRLDVLMCNEFNWTARRRTLMSAKYTVRLLVFAAMIGSTMFFYVSLVSWDIAYVVFICLGIRVRCLQLTFYVHQLHARLLQLNAEMRRGCIVTAEAADHDSVMDDARCSGLCRAYDAIWNISERINDSFGWSTLSVAADATLVAVVKTYLVFKLHVYFCLAELVPTLVTFAVVCWTCDDCAQTVNALTDVYRQDVIPIERWINLWRAIGGGGLLQYSETVDLAGRINHTTSPDSDVKLNMQPPLHPVRQSFSLQLAHQRIQFHASGFFQINLQLVASVCTTRIFAFDCMFRPSCSDIRRYLVVHNYPGAVFRLKWVSLP